MELIGDPIVERGVREQRFDVHCQGRRVPGLLWAPESGGATRLVLLGHGGSLHKRADYILSTARRLVRHHGFAAVAIDGPAHGDRRPDGGLDREQARAEFDKVWQRRETSDEIVADWKAALDAVQAELGDGPVGYFGLSMGTMMGLPLCAAEPRIRAAVLGLMGDWGPNAGILRDAAAKITIPVRFLMQWDDELIPRERALELFDALGSRDKGLHAHPGRHAAVPADEMRAVPAFLAERLS